MLEKVCLLFDAAADKLVSVINNIYTLTFLFEPSIVQHVEERMQSNMRPGARGWEPHAAGEEGGVEHDDDGAGLHQGHGQVGHGLEPGVQTSKQLTFRDKSSWQS